MINDHGLMAIDPGLTGAVAFFADGGAQWVQSVPIVQVAKTRKDISPQAFADMVEDCVAGSVEYAAVIEKIGGRPQQGIASTCNFCRGYGVMLGVLAAFKVPTTLTTPQAWKRHAGLIGKDKRVSVALAHQQFPHLSRSIKHHGHADALLIGAHHLYCTRHQQVEP